MIDSKVDFLKADMFISRVDDDLPVSYEFFVWSTGLPTRIQVTLNDES